jgi:phosphatidylserine/phosphatidylglycerophosphate/cardiolipin synthase-like enzyme
MDAEKTIAEIELLERIYALADSRPLRMADWKAANKKHDETYANNLWFRLWKRDGG